MNYDISVNYWAVFVAAIAYMVVGYIWYSLPVFGRMWIAAIGKTEQEIKEGYKPVTMLWTYILAAIGAYVLAHFIRLVGTTTMTEALQTAAWAWVGFIAVTMATNAFYEGRSARLFWINALYQLVSILIAAAILFAWQ
ncbi:MAG: DUF1761 domain-containing protein [Candidatus Berkelbacteria bacterium]|nr:MAG: DUF1761 domain-containing protein [Candidatus Berkelbacteria bacterium]QQG52029.1 MAG: DUF1761 domain-containing protein [Candidatus Berkelbacteria bacterium]